jgi:outer membrane protein TolC
VTIAVPREAIPARTLRGTAREGAARKIGATIVTNRTKTSIIALLAAFIATTSASRAFAQTPAPAPGEASFSDLIASELATSGGLTSNEVARRAMQTSPAARARSEELLAAGAEVDRALYAYIPRVSVGASYTRLSDTKGGSASNVVAAPGAPAGPLRPETDLVNSPLTFETPLNKYGLQASLTVPLSDYVFRIGPSHESAKFRQTVAREELRAEMLKAGADARISYYDWARARLNLIVAEQSLSQARAHLTDATTRLAAGTLSQADVMRIESEVAQSELLVISTNNLSELTEEQLRTAMHDQSGRGYRIGEDLRLPAVSTLGSRLAELWAEAQRSRPELRALNAQRSAQVQATSTERAAYGPRLELVANTEYSNPNSRIFPTTEEFRGSWDAGARLTWVLSDVPSATAAVRDGEARARAIQAERAALADQIRLQVMSAFQDRAEARVAEGTTARRLLAAEESYRTRRLLFQNGRATTVELLDAETDLTRARLEAVSASIDGRVAEVRLAHAIGRADRP